MYARGLKKLARILTRYSTAVRKGDTVLIDYSGENSFPLVREVYRECIRRKAAHVEYRLTDPRLTRDFFDLAAPDQIEKFPQHRLEFLRRTDVSIGIRAEDNMMNLATVPREKIAARTKVLRPLLDWRVNHTRWVVTRVPTPAMAQEAGCSIEEMEEAYIRSCLQDWKAESEKQERLADVLRAGREVRILGRDTDLTLDIGGMPVLKADGHRNMPDGEVFTAPRRSSACGKIKFNCPSYFGGTKFAGVYLEFERGKVVLSRADTGAEDLADFLDIDEGARYLGEFAFGLNPGITKPVGNILFDEKISGSIHLALGGSYDACSNGNSSAIHWDLVRMMNEEGEVYLDGRLIQKNGQFTVPELSDLNPAN